MSVAPQEWEEFKQRVKECGVSKRVVMESSNTGTWDSPDTRRQKEAEQTLQAKASEVRALRGGKRVSKKAAANAKAKKAS